MFSSGVNPVSKATERYSSESVIHSYKFLKYNIHTNGSVCVQGDERAADIRGLVLSVHSSPFRAEASSRPDQQTPATHQRDKTR